MMADTARPERESWWVLRAQSGDAQALNELLKAVSEPLYRYILSVVREAHSAEDILQEVLIRIYRKLGWLKEPEMFRSWSYRIASREAFRHLKRNRRWTEQIRDEAVLTSLTSSVSGEELAPEVIHQLHERVAILSPASRAVIVLHYLHEMSLDEVAAVLGISVGTVKSRLAYGLEHLRRQYKSR